MAIKFSCQCSQKNIEEYRLEHWKIVQYKENRSAFNGYKRTPSDYSTVKCDVCGATGRTKANYVDDLFVKNFFVSKEEKQLYAGCLAG